LIFLIPCAKIIFVFSKGGVKMEYTLEQIRGFAAEHTKKLMNEEYIVETLPNSEYLYTGKMEEMYSEAIRNTDSNSRLFKATYED
jgi:hypothetical protein